MLFPHSSFFLTLFLRPRIFVSLIIFGCETFYPIKVKNLICLQSNKQQIRFKFLLCRFVQLDMWSTLKGLPQTFSKGYIMF